MEARPRKRRRVSLLDLPSEIERIVFEYHVWWASDAPPAWLVYHLRLDVSPQHGSVFPVLQSLSMCDGYNRPLDFPLPDALTTLVVGRTFDQVLPSRRRCRFWRSANISTPTRYPTCPRRSARCA